MAKAKADAATVAATAAAPLTKKERIEELDGRLVSPGLLIPLIF